MRENRDFVFPIVKIRKFWRLHRWYTTEIRFLIFFLPFLQRLHLPSNWIQVKKMKGISLESNDAIIMVTKHWPRRCFRRFAFVRLLAVPANKIHYPRAPIIALTIPNRVYFKLRWATDLASVFYPESPRGPSFRQVSFLGGFIRRHSRGSSCCYRSCDRGCLTERSCELGCYIMEKKRRKKMYILYDWFTHTAQFTFLSILFFFFS